MVTGREVQCGRVLLDEYFTTSGPEGPGHGWRFRGKRVHFEYRVAADGSAVATVTEMRLARPYESSDDDPPREPVVVASAPVASPDEAGTLFEPFASEAYAR